MSSRFPLAAYPRGWFQVGYSSQLTGDAPLSTHLFGQDLLAYRGQDGRAVLAEPYCPHLGAHIGYGGRVEAGRLVCPFHGWRFDETGRNCEIPYAPNPNRKARLATWRVEEKYGMLLTWFPQHETPAWSLADFTAPDEFAENLTRGSVLRNDYDIQTHPQEIFENTVDAAHFIELHKCLEPPQVVTKTENHRFSSLTSQVLRGSGGAPMRSRVDSRLYGPGLDVNVIEWDGVRLHSLMNVTPVDANSVHVWMQGFVALAPDGRDPARLYQRAVLSEFDKDVVIWQHKKYVEAPLLAAGERAIIEFRRWASQFYAGLPEPESPAVTERRADAIPVTT